MLFPDQVGSGTDMRQLLKRYHADPDSATRRVIDAAAWRIGEMGMYGSEHETHLDIAFDHAECFLAMHQGDPESVLGGLYRSMQSAFDNDVYAGAAASRVIVGGMKPLNAVQATLTEASMNAAAAKSQGELAAVA
jgi:hypothetical protein